MVRELTAAEVRRTIDPQSLGIETTESLKPLQGIIGQKRAVSALQFGLGIHEIGFNIYVAGPPGIGKMTAVQAFLDQLARLQPTPPDWCYVNNFIDPYQPHVFSLPAGRGRALQQDMKAFVAQVRREIPKAFESEEYNTKRDEIRNDSNKQREQLLAQYAHRAGQAGFTLEATPYGVALVPAREGRPLSEAQFDALAAPLREEIAQRHQDLQKDMQGMMKQVRGIERSLRERLGELDKQVALYVVGGLIEDLIEKYGDLDEVQSSFLRHFERPRRGHHTQLGTFFIDHPDLWDPDHLVYAQVSSYGLSPWLPVA